MRNVAGSNSLGNFLSDQHFLFFVFFFPGLICWKMSLNRKGSPRWPSHVLLQRRAEMPAQRRWQERWGDPAAERWSRLCSSIGMATSRGCGSSPQTPLNIQLPQHQVWWKMFAEPRANTQVANPWVPCSRNCPRLITPSICKGQIYPHKLQFQLVSTATP